MIILGYRLSNNSLYILIVLNSSKYEVVGPVVSVVGSPDPILINTSLHSLAFAIPT